MKKSGIRKSVNYAVAVLFFCSTTMNLAGCAKSGATPSALNTQSSTGDGSGASGSGSGGTSGGGTSGGDQIANDWAQVDTTGYSTGSFWGNTQIISISQSAMTITFSIPIEVNFLGGIGITNQPIPEIPGGTLSLVQNTDGLWALDVTMPLQDLVKGISFTSPTTLPSGNPLPAVPGGELPSVAAHIQDGSLNFYAYGSVIYFALFFPIPNFNPYVDLTFPIKNSAGTQILGYLATVTPVGTNAGGMYFAMAFPAALQRLLDDLFPQ